MGEKINYAQELAHKVCERKKEYENHVALKVEEYVKKWLAEDNTQLVRVFSLEDCDKLFDTGKESCEAMAEFRKMGFEAEYFDSETTGHLWWKKCVPAKWVVKVPVECIREASKKK